MRRHNYFINIASKYFLILLIPLIFSIAINTVSINSIKNNSLESYNKLLHLISVESEKMISECRSYFQKITSDPNIYRFYMSDENDKIEQLNLKIALQDKFESISELNHTDYNLTMILYDNEYVISSDHVLKYTDNYFDHLMVFEDEEYIERLFNYNYDTATVLPTTYIHSENVTSQYIVMARSIYCDIYSSEPSGIVMATIDTDRYSRLFADMSNNDEIFFVLNEFGDIMVSNVHNSAEIAFLQNIQNGETISINDKKMITNSIKSEHNGWTYVAYVSEDKLMYETNQLRTIIAYSYIALLIGGIGVIFILSYKTVAPYKQITSLLNQKINNNNDLDTYKIDYTIKLCADLLNKYDELEKANGSKYQFLQTFFTAKLLNGDYANEESIRKMANSLEFRYFKYYTVMGIFILFPSDMSRETRQNLTKLHIDAIKYNAGCRNINAFHERYTNNIYKLLICHDEILSNVDLEDLIQMSMPKDNEAARIKIEISETCEDILQICSCNTQVTNKITLYKESANRSEIVQYNESDNDISIYNQISREYVRKLSYYIKMGNTVVVTETLDSFYNEHTNDNKFSVLIFIQFLSELKSILMNICYELKMPDKADALANEIKITKPYDLVSIFKTIKAEYINVVEQIKENKINQHSDIIMTIKAYIDENYTDCNLCIEQISTKFKINESYFSHSFKQHLGEGFVKYLQNLRISHACRIIESGKKIKHSDIMEQVGFNSSTTFRRAFREVTNMSPSEYAKKYQK